MLAIAYNPQTQMFRAMRNNEQGHAESKEFCDGVIRQQYPDDMALRAVLAEAKSNPGVYTMLPTVRKSNRVPANHPNRIPSRMVL
jgi:hypothetical protein